MNSTATASYNGIAKTLHWLIALGIIAMLVIGWTMTSLPRTAPEKFALFQWHKSIGITILLLSLLRLGWRLIHTAPPFPATMARWEKITAKTTHALFYILIIGLPLTGWIIVSSSSMNVPTMLYGIIPWPNLPGLAGNKPFGHAVGELHEQLAFLIAGLLVLHVAAAWKHHLFDRDDVLLRMAPRFLHPFLNRLR